MTDRPPGADASAGANGSADAPAGREAPLADRYRALVERLDRWFADARARHPGVIPCASGCAACCHGPFDISAADVVLIRAGLLRLSVPERRAVLARARAQVDAARALAPDWRSPFEIAAIGEERFDAVTEALAERPCPLLDDAGRCRIYADRPLTCRAMGLGLASPGGRVLENTCPIRARFPSYASLPPARFDLEGLEAEEAPLVAEAARALFDDSGGDDAPAYATFIAGAIVALAGD